MKNKHSKSDRVGRNKALKKTRPPLAANVTISLPVNPDLSERIFPCRSNEEVREALVKELHLPIRIEVAGGIVRHGW